MIHKQQLCRSFSVKLSFEWAPKDLMVKFIDCLIRLPNLKTLEILSVSSRAPISKALKWKHAIFPTIRELRITHDCHHFIRNCPNLENLTLTDGFDIYSPDTVRSHGVGLKRIAGVNVFTRHYGEGVGGESEQIVQSEQPLREDPSQRLLGAARTFGRSALSIAPT